MRFPKVNIRAAAAAALVFACAAPAVAGAQEQHRTGLLFMRPDELAKIPPAFTPFSGAELPRRVDLSADFPPPGNQGQQSSCVAWATAYALRSYQAHVRSHASLVTGDGHIDSARVFSPAFIYNQINNGRDAGSVFSDAFALMQSKGVAPLQYMPYSQNDYRTMPNPAALNVAANYRIAFWKQINVNELVELKSQLNAGYPVIIGAMVDEGFDHAGKGFVWDHVGGRQLGGHAMLVVGYDDDRNAFRVLNSWGTGWGDHGYYWLDYTLFPKVVSEAFVAKDALDPPVPPTPTSDAPISAADAGSRSNPAISASDAGSCSHTAGSAAHPDPGSRSSAGSRSSSSSRSTVSRCVRERVRECRSRQRERGRSAVRAGHPLRRHGRRPARRAGKSSDRDPALFTTRVAGRRVRSSSLRLRASPSDACVLRPERSLSPSSHRNAQSVVRVSAVQRAQAAIGRKCFTRRRAGSLRGQIRSESGSEARAPVRLRTLRR